MTLRKNTSANFTHVTRYKAHLVVLLHQPLVVSDVLHLVQEPAVDLGELIQLVHRVAGSEGRRQHKDTLVCRSLQLLESRRSNQPTMDQYTSAPSVGPVKNHYSFNT